ncbi:expressed unknown protein [Seminavis robusta]|uniref:Uncharacterized protein n=1 Tax=Seminavis robusta TaxID=568900 RepID=A0A9N8F181_9STRA|nr:expressed unknown protein [Seminavis robusta]|eukprot:Sro2978_g341420.1 n/a (206) ;mRNA; r:1586-2312
MNFPVAVPQSGILGSGDPRDNRAPAINVGENFDGQVEDAAIEYSNRKRLRDRDPNSVTEDEVKASRRRLVALETFEAQAAHGMGNGAVLASVANLTTTVNNLATTVNNLATTVNNLATTVNNSTNSVTAMLRNIRIRERNRHGEWDPVLVEQPGPNAMGVAPATFPASHAAVFAMNGAAIAALQNAYNLPAGFFWGGTLLTDEQR